MTIFKTNLFLLLFLFALTLTVGSFVLQFGFNLEPCSLCMIARALVIAITALFGLALIHRPKAIGEQIYRFLGSVLALIGIAVTARHLWILHSPLSNTPDCIPNLNYLLQILPLREAITLALRGSHECSEDLTSFLGIPLPGWTLLGFLAIALMSAMPWKLLQKKIRKA